MVTALVRFNRSISLKHNQDMFGFQVLFMKIGSYYDTTWQLVYLVVTIIIFPLTDIFQMVY